MLSLGFGNFTQRRRSVTKYLIYATEEMSSASSLSLRSALSNPQQLQTSVQDMVTFSSGLTSRT